MLLLCHRPNKGKGKAAESPAADDSMVSANIDGSPSQATKQPAKRRAPGKAEAAVGKAEKAPAGKARTVGPKKAAQPKAGKSGDQAIDKDTAGEAEKQQGTNNAGSKGRRPGRKGKHAPADGQQKKAAAIPDGQKSKAAPASKGTSRVQQPATCSKQEHSKAEEDEQTAASDHVPSSPVGVAKAQLKHRGRKALTDNGAEQDDDAATAVDSPSRKVKGTVKAPVTARQKAASKGQKGVSGGQKQEAKVKQPSRQKQPR